MARTAEAPRRQVINGEAQLAASRQPMITGKGKLPITHHLTCYEEFYEV